MRGVNLIIAKIQETKDTKYDNEQIELMVSSNIDKRIQQGNVKGFNLSY